MAGRGEVNAFQSLFASDSIRWEGASRVSGIWWSHNQDAGWRCAFPSYVATRFQPIPTPVRGDTLALEADHRRHAEIENAIRDLKYGVGLNHLPSGRFAANAAWLAVQVMAHNLALWTARIGLGERMVTTKTLRRRFFSIAGRLTRSARRLTLHLPKRWSWKNQFSRALARLRALPFPA